MVAIQAFFSWKTMTGTLCCVLLSFGMICTEAISGGQPIRLVCGAQWSGGGETANEDANSPADGPSDLRGRTVVVVLESDSDHACDETTQPPESEEDADLGNAEPTTMQKALDTFYADCNATRSDETTTDDQQTALWPEPPWETEETDDCQYEDQYESTYDCQYDTTSPSGTEDGYGNDDQDSDDCQYSEDKYTGSYDYNYDYDYGNDTPYNTASGPHDFESADESVEGQLAAAAKAGAWNSYLADGAVARQLSGVALQAVELATSLQCVNTVRVHVGNMWAHVDELVRRSELGQAWQDWHVWAGVIEQLASDRQRPGLADENGTLVGPMNYQDKGSDLAASPQNAVTADSDQNWYVDENWYTDQNWYVDETPLGGQNSIVESPTDRVEVVTAADLHRGTLVWAARALDRLGVACQRASRQLERMATHDSAATTLARQPDTVSH